jgi:hypothetical protein
VWTSRCWLSQTQTLLTKICQVCNEIHDIKLDAQSHQRNNKYVRSVNRKHTRGVHIINEINILRQEEDGIVNNHKVESEDIHGREHRGYNYLTGKSPTCLMGAENSAYNHDDCEEHPTQTLSHLTPERLKSSHASSPNPSELALMPLESPPSSLVLCQSSSPSDPSPSSSELPDPEVTSLRGGMMLDSDLALVMELEDPVEFGDLGKGVLQCAAKDEPCSTPPTKDGRYCPPLQK